MYVLYMCLFTCAFVLVTYIFGVYIQECRWLCIKAQSCRGQSSTLVFFFFQFILIALGQGHSVARCFQFILSDWPVFSVGLLVSL